MKRNAWVSIAGIIASILLLSASQEQCDTNTISLNGDWELYAGSQPGEYKYKVQVPGLVDLARPKLAWQKYPYFFYKRKFDLDIKGASYNRAWLKIDGSFWGTQVWINGNYVGQSYRCFAPIEFEVRKFLRKQNNEIIIRVGTYASVPPDKILIGYDNEKGPYIPGIWGDVNLTFTADQRIRNLLVISEPENKQLKVKYFIQNVSDQPKKVTISGRLDESNCEGCSAQSDLTEIPAKSEKEILLSIPLPNPHLWTPQDPYLYSIESELSAPAIFSPKEIEENYVDCLTNAEHKMTNCPNGIPVSGDQNNGSGFNMAQECPKAKSLSQDEINKMGGEEKKIFDDCMEYLADPEHFCAKKEQKDKADCAAQVAKLRVDPSYKENLDSDKRKFGVRKFEIKDGDFYLNGKHVRLFGSNIAFQRWLADPERRGLAWDEKFIKKVLVEIPKSHNMIFFRNHVGPLYSKWYDIADENGILLQDEYFLWGGPTRDAGHYIPDEKIWWDEYRAWMEARWNHPSIIIYDLENESPKDMIAFLNQNIAPKVRALDPTRPIEPLDFQEDHPYSWSLSGVINTRWMGGKDIPTGRPFADLSRKDVPIVVNEFPWFWADAMGRPTKTTIEVLTRWLGPDAIQAPPDQVLKYQAWLTRELVELYRRIDVDAIQPFVYISHGQGTAANYFLGPLDQLTLKPVMEELKEAYKPQAVSLELWDRHFFPGEKRKLKVYVFNDDPDKPFSGKVTAEISKWKQEMQVSLEPAEHKIVEVEYQFPDETGSYDAMATLAGSDGQEIYTSTKRAIVYNEPGLPDEIKFKHICVLDPAGETTKYLEKIHARFSKLEFSKSIPDKCMAVVVAPGAVQAKDYKFFKLALNSYLLKGKGAAIIEPEFGADPEKYAQLVRPAAGAPMLYANTWKFIGEDIPGKDSAVWPTALGRDSKVFAMIDSDDLYFFNGGIGEEMVSELVAFPLSYGKTLAKSSIWLMKPVVLEYKIGKGTLIVSRVQVHGRLMGEEQKDLWSRRPDPVAQRLFLNLITEAYEKGEGKK